MNQALILIMFDQYAITIGSSIATRFIAWMFNSLLWKCGLNELQMLVIICVLTWNKLDIYSHIFTNLFIGTKIWLVCNEKNLINQFIYVGSLLKDNGYLQTKDIVIIIISKFQKKELIVYLIWPALNRKRNVVLDNLNAMTYVKLFMKTYIANYDALNQSILSSLSTVVWSLF